MKKHPSKVTALGGILAALAIVIMCLGGLIPFATYVCPMLCALLCFTVFRFCGRRIAWTWYAAVAILSVLIGPDKEAAMVFLFVGYYPIIKPRLDCVPFAVLWKLLLFNISAVLVFAVQLLLFGVQMVMAEYAGIGAIWLIVFLLLGNVAFFLLDMLLNRLSRKI